MLENPNSEIVKLSFLNIANILDSEIKYTQLVLNNVELLASIKNNIQTDSLEV